MNKFDRKCIIKNCKIGNNINQTAYLIETLKLIKDQKREKVLNFTTAFDLKR